MIPPPLAWQAHVPATRVWALVVALQLRAFCHPHPSCLWVLAAFLRRREMAVGVRRGAEVQRHQPRQERPKPESMRVLQRVLAPLQSVAPSVPALRTQRVMPPLQTEMMTMTMQVPVDWNRTARFYCCFVGMRLVMQVL